MKRSIFGKRRGTQKRLGKGSELIDRLKDRKGGSGTFIIDDVYCKYYLDDLSKPIVITFHGLILRPLTHQEAGDKLFSPWGYEYVKKLGLNVISFAPVESTNWYRSPEFHDFLGDLGNMLQSYEKVLGYGGSMGGYGVSAFADVLHMTNILLLAPISTLNRQLAPFETRFYKYRKYNWADSFHDGAATNCKGYILYDPIYDLDRSHAVRYKNLTELKVPGMGHSTPEFFNAFGILKWISESFLLKGTIDKESFYKLVRHRREILSYYNWLLSDQNTHLTEKRKEVITKYKNAFIGSDKEKIFNELDIGQKEKALYILADALDRAGNTALSDKVLSEERSVSSIIEQYDELADILRETAQLFERRGEIDDAVYLLELAQILRPQGNVIRQKLLSLQRRQML